MGGRAEIRLWRVGASGATTVLVVVVTAACVPAAPVPPQASPTMSASTEWLVPGDYEVVPDLCAAAHLTPLTARMPVVKRVEPSTTFFTMGCQT